MFGWCVKDGLGSQHWRSEQDSTVRWWRRKIAAKVVWVINALDLTHTGFPLTMILNWHTAVERAEKGKLFLHFQLELVAISGIKRFEVSVVNTRFV